MFVIRCYHLYLKEEQIRTTHLGNVLLAGILKMPRLQDAERNQYFIDSFNKITKYSKYAVLNYIHEQSTKTRR